jgi:LacI family transcriptional regulator
VVLVNNEQGGYDATRYLIGLGHRRIACITGPPDPTPSAERVYGYKRALREFGLPIEEELIVPGGFHYQGGERAMEQLLRLDKPPSAVFACNDVMAIGAMRAIRHAGLRVPSDVSIVGFDDIPLASAVSPVLTTVAQPIVELATLAAELLMSRIQNGQEDGPGQQFVLDTKLVTRDSCAPR